MKRRHPLGSGWVPIHSPGIGRGAWVVSYKHGHGAYLHIGPLTRRDVRVYTRLEDDELVVEQDRDGVVGAGTARRSTLVAVSFPPSAVALVAGAGARDESVLRRRSEYPEGLCAVAKELAGLARAPMWMLARRVDRGDSEDRCGQIAEQLWDAGFCELVEEETEILEGLAPEWTGSPAGLVDAAVRLATVAAR